MIANQLSSFSTANDIKDTMPEAELSTSKSEIETETEIFSYEYNGKALADKMPAEATEELTITERTEREPAKIAETAAQFAQIMMLYDAGIKEVKTKLDILANEFKVKRNRSPIEAVQCRIKEPASIIEKMGRRGYPMTLASMTQNISDIAGVRVICPFIQDIYTVADMLTSQDDIFIIKKKDYINRPKENGYRSLHLVIEVPVFLSDRKQHVRVEIQIRTIAMDFWASLEHQLHYKKEAEVPDGIIDDLRRCAQTISETDEKMQEIARRLKSI